ncbi:hypothetical protein R1flu_015025 [Riccia fluitans]|uniref:Uncharacterized protein n=1 Tax=Riccia fluitans TaxID=41844 RepID=A0ABD1YL29_9MARC
MSRIKKRRPAPGFPKGSSGKQFSMLTCRRGQPTSKEASFKNRPKHTYSTRPYDYLKRKSPKTPAVNAPPPPPRVISAEKVSEDGEVPVQSSCAALPALVLTSCQTQTTPTPSPRRYHHSCAVTPEHSHRPKTGDTPRKDFDSYALRHLAEKAIRHSRKVAAQRTVEQDRERCRQHSCIGPPPLKTRHKHYCGTKRYKNNGTVFQMMKSALEKGLDAFRSMIEDGPIGESARYCRRRIKRLLRPIWCNCLRHTCLGPPADQIQRHVYTRGQKLREKAQARELRKTLSRLPTPVPSSPHPSNLTMDGSEPADLEESNTGKMSLPQQPLTTETPGCIAGCSLLKSNELLPLQHDNLHPKQQQHQKPHAIKVSTPKLVKSSEKIGRSSSPKQHTHLHRHVKGLGRQVHAGHVHVRI